MIDRDSLIASVVGAMTAAFMLKKDSVARRAGMAIGGVALAYVFGPQLVNIFPQLSPPASGGLIAMFGMAGISKAYEVADAISPGDLIRRIYKRLGLGDE